MAVSCHLLTNLEGSTNVALQSFCLKLNRPSKLLSIFIVLIVCAGVCGVFSGVPYVLTECYLTFATATAGTHLISFQQASPTQGPKQSMLLHTVPNIDKRDHA